LQWKKLNSKLIIVQNKKVVLVINIHLILN